MNKLAIMGGKAVRDRFLPYGQQCLDDLDYAAVEEVLKGKNITQGKTIDLFEDKIAAKVGAKHAIAYSNGTAALHGACYAAGIGPGDEVLVPPITFVASANCVLYMGARPVFVDIDPRTYNIDPDKIEDAITDKTKALVVVDFTGQPVDIEPIREIAERYDLVIIQDAAHSLAAYYEADYEYNEVKEKKMVGQTADMTMFSFHPVKHITTGEGGMIVTDSDELAQSLRTFRSHGITSDPNLMHDNQGPWYYEMQELGYNYRMTDIQAGLGASQADKLDKFVEQRRKLAKYYDQALADVRGVTRPYQLPGTNSSWHLYSISLDLERFTGTRREIFEAMRTENIGVHVHYIPVHLQPYYQSLGYERGTCPVAETWYERAMTLPLYPKMIEADVDDVVRALEKVLDYYRK